MKIRPVGVELFHADGRTDRHDKADNCFSQFRHVPKMDSFYRSRVTIWRGTYSVCSVRRATVILRKGAPNTSNCKQTRYPKCCVLFGMLHGQGWKFSHRKLPSAESAVIVDYSADNHKLQFWFLKPKRQGYIHLLPYWYQTLYTGNGRIIFVILFAEYVPS
jgi:hypothetical protein